VVSVEKWNFERDWIKKEENRSNDMTPNDVFGADSWAATFLDIRDWTSTDSNHFPATREQ
jgi:hypothetical protein